MFKKLNHNGNNFEFPDNEKGRKDYEAFIAKFPDATEVAIAPDPEEEGKETPSQEIKSAPVEESVALEPTTTESISEDISLDSQKIDNSPEAIFKRRKQNALDQAKISSQPIELEEVIVTFDPSDRKPEDLIDDITKIDNRIKTIAGDDMQIDALDSPKRIKEYSTLINRRKEINDNLRNKLKEEGSAKSLLRSLKKGDKALGEYLLSVPSFIYEIGSLVSDPVNRALGLPETDLTKFEESIGTRPLLDSLIDEQNKLGKIQEEYKDLNNIEGGIGENFSKGNISEGFYLLGETLAESAPVSLSLMFGGAAGLSRTALTLGGGVPLAAGEMRAQQEEYPEQEKAEMLLKSALIGLSEGFFEGVFGSGAIGKTYKNIIAKEGIEQGTKTFKNGIISMYEGALQKFGVPVAVVSGGLEEVGTQITQNLVNGKPFNEGVTDAFLAGVGGGGLYGAPVNLAKGVELGRNLIQEIKVNAEIKPTEYTNISYAFDPVEKTNETQIKLSQLKNSDKVLQRSVDSEIKKGNITQEQGDAIKLNFRDTQSAVNQIKPLKLVEQDQAIAVQLMKEKKQLKNQIEQVGEPSLTTEQSDRIKQIDEDLKGIGSKAVTQQVEKIREAAKDITDLDIQEFATTAETEAFLNEQGQDIKASAQQGFIIQNKDGKQTIVINREIADKEIAVAAPAHEFLHAILYKTIKDSPATALQLGNSLMEYISKIDINQVKDSNFAQRLQQYQDQPTEVQAEEALTLFSDAILTGDIKFKENIFTKLRDVISKILQVGGVKARFDTGRDVYNFIRDYNKNIQEGKLTSQQIRTAEEGVKLDIQDQAVKEAETVIKESRSEEASNKVQEIYEQKGINGALDIIEQFKPITNKIVDQRKNAPNFDRQLLTDEIETGAGGILDLIQAYDPASNVPLAAYINKYLPVRAITASRRILGEEFIDDITESVQVAAETAPEVEIEVAETKPTEKLIEVKKQVLSESNQKELEDIVAEKLPELTTDQFTFKTLPNWAKQTLAKEIDIPVKKFEGSSNFTQAELNRVISFIENNIDTVRKALPDAAVLEGAPVSEGLIGTATGVPNNLLKDTNLYTRLERGTKKAGLVPFQKNKGIDNSSILKAIGVIEGTRTAGPRDKQAQTAKGIINVLAKFITNQEIRKQADLTPQQKTDIETGKGSRLLFSLNTKGDGTWAPDLLNPLSGNKFYNFNVANRDFRISLFENDDFDYEILELTEGIKDDAFVNDPKSMAIAFRDIEDDSTEITGRIGAKDSIKVFSIVANSVLDIIKQDNLNSITFTAKEPNRQRLYEAMVQKFQKELGWESYTFPVEGETAFIVYNPEVFKSKEAAPSDTKESRLLFSRAKSDKPLKDKYNLKLYNLESIEGRKQYLNDIEFILWPVYGDALKSGQLYGLGVGQKNKIFIKEIQSLIKKLKKENPINAFSVPTGMSKPTQAQGFGKYGNNYEGLLKLKETGELSEINRINSILWEEFWEKTNILIKNNPKAIIPVLQLLQTATNDTTHINRRGAPLVAVDLNFTKSGKYEHAVPNVLAYMYLLDSILDPNLDFKTEFNFIKNNYKLIALSVENNKLLDKVFRDTMPENWKNWYDRYFNPEIAKLGGINPVNIQSLITNDNLSVELGINVDGSKLNKSDKEAQIKLSKSKSKAAVKNNLELPKSQRLPKGSTNEQVLAKMQELDNEANEARIKYSKSQNLDEAFNDIIEAKTGIETYKRFSPAKATVRGASKGKFNFFIPPSAEDFTGLLYKTLAKGKLGDRQMQWYKDNLLDPYARAMNDISAARVAMFEDYKALKEDLEIIPKDLKKKSVDEYTREQAVRVYIWNSQDNNIPGLFKTDQKELVDYVNNDPELRLFAEQLIAIQKNDIYSAPKEGWLTGSITTDLLDNVNSIKRKKYLEQWQNNVDEIFSEVNMNKLEAAFGKPYRKALENILTRMKTGRNKPFTSDSLAGRVTDWLNNSVGAIMFFNTRSAVLQTISSINFINWSDNNIYQAGKAFANQPQYWKDFKFLFNSDFLKERRGGLRFNVSESEIADAAKKGGARGVISKILQAGFLPTQVADSFAIASGGATFYRNRLNAYLKETDVDGNKIYTEAEAQEKAFLDFREIAEESQQSSRPDRISAQQAGPLGRTILAFANTPAQYARLTKKAASDLINGRGDAKTNISKLLYYGAVQNLIFNVLQQAAFAIAFGDSEEDEKEKEEKYISIANGMADGLLRGIGLGGAVIATLKNALIKIIKESEKKRPDYAETTVIQLLGISPPIQSKAQKIRSALKSYEWNKKEMLEKGFSLDNPAYLAGANVISASTNVPLDRIIKKVDNVRAATRDDISKLERMMLLAGWSDWQLGIQKPKEVKPKKKKKPKFKRVRKGER